MLEEDARLEHLVKEKKGWSRVAYDTMMRSPRQCSDRWHEHLACDLYHHPFTVQGAAAPRSAPRRPLEGDQACNARQGLVALVLDERHGRNKVWEAMLFHESLFIFATKQYLEFGSVRDSSRVIPMPTKHKIWCS
jgi:hypothetical protein